LKLEIRAELRTKLGAKPVAELHGKLASHINMAAVTMKKL